MNKSTDLYQTVKNNKNLKSSVSFSQLDEVIPLNNISNTNLSSDEISNHYETLSFNDSNTNLANSVFSKEWHSSKRLYLNIQISFIGINFLITLILLSLSIWINIDRRFLLLSSLGNISYSSLNRIIGLLPLVSLMIFSLSFILDLSHLFLFAYVKKFLNSHDQSQIDEILNNQKLVLKLNYETKHLQLRSQIRKQIKVVLTSLRLLHYMIAAFYFVVVLGTQFFIALFIHFNFDLIINYQLSTTIRKIVKEYEKKQIEFLNKLDTMIISFRYIETKSLEEHLIDEMNINFECCNYQNPFQFGDLAPASCNYERGCLKPIQTFTWNLLYYLVLILLVTAGLRFCFQFILWFNYKILLTGKLINGLYEYDLKNYEFDENEENELEEKEKLKKELRLKQIRLNKELELQKEEEEEERLAKQKEDDYQKFLQQERIQDEYEKMLEKQHRFEELKLEKLKRKLQAEHLIDSSQIDNF
jgi:hypothetical protein